MANEDQADPQPGILSVLENIQTLLANSLEIQQAMAENLVFTRDEVLKLHKRVGVINERVGALESKVGVPTVSDTTTTQIDASEIAESISSAVANSVNVIADQVKSLKDGIGLSVQIAVSDAQTDRLAQVSQSLARIAGEVEALRDLTLDSINPGSTNV